MCKKLIYLISFAVVLSVIGNASGDLVVQWTFDEGSGTVVPDRSGNGYDGAFVGMPEWADGYHDGGVHFVAEGQSVLFASNNNQAVDVIRERLERFESDFPIAIRAGSRKFNNIEESLRRTLNVITGSSNGADIDDNVIDRESDESGEDVLDRENLRLTLA